MAESIKVVSNYDIKCPNCGSVKLESSSRNNSPIYIEFYCLSCKTKFYTSKTELLYPQNGLNSFFKRK